MKKIKTAEEYLLDTMRCTIDDDADLDINENFYFQWEDILKTLKAAQLDMLEYAVNKCIENSKIKQLITGTRNDGIIEYVGYGYEVDKQSILKTIDEIKEELKV